MIVAFFSEFMGVTHPSRDVSFRTDLSLTSPLGTSEVPKDGGDDRYC